MREKKNLKKGFTLAEMMVTISVMAIVLALVTLFVAASSSATKKRTAQSETLKEIDSLNSLITDWFYAFDDSDYTVAECTTGGEAPEYIYDFEADTAIQVNTKYITIQNKNFSNLMSGGIVPTNYQIVYSIDRATYEPAITAIYSSDSNDNVSLTLRHVKDINFTWEETLRVFKCVYTYEDAETGNDKIYTLVLPRHTAG